MAAQRCRIKALEKQKQDLLLRAQELGQSRKHLLLKHALLTAWCEALTHVQYAGQHADAPSDQGIEAQFQQLLNEEIALLGELTFNEQLVSGTADSGVLPDPGPNTLSPGDPVAFFRACLAQPPSQEVESWTALDAATMLRETVLQASLVRTLQQAHCDTQEVSPAKQLWDRYLHAVTSSARLGREEINEGLSFYNLDTLQSAPENAAAAAQRTATIAPLLGLTDQQKDIITAGADICDSMTALLHKQRQEVMEKIAAAAAAADAATSTEEHSGQPGSRSGGLSSSRQGSWPPGTAAATAAAAQEAAAAAGAVPACEGPGMQACAGGNPGTLGAFQDWQQQMETQQQLATRLKLLMSKQYMLVTTLCGLMIGCMTYDQCTLCAMLAWPYVTRVYYLAMDVRKLRQQELAEQQQQQQQQRGSHRQQQHTMAGSARTRQAAGDAAGSTGASAQQWPAAARADGQASLQTGQQWAQMLTD